MQKMQNMQNVQTWTPVAYVPLQQRNKGPRVLFHPVIGLGFDREQQKRFAEPDIVSALYNKSLICRIC
jgi:hypothetical protein